MAWLTDFVIIITEDGPDFDKKILTGSTVSAEITKWSIVVSVI